MHSHDICYPIYNHKYHLYNYANAFSNNLESNTHAMQYIHQLLLKAKCSQIQIFAEKGYGYLSAFKENARFHFRCEFQATEIHLLNFLKQTLDCEIFENNENYVLFIDEEFLYNQLNVKLQKLWRDLSLPGEIKKGEHKEFEYSGPSSTITEAALKDFGLEVVTSHYPHASIQGIKISDYTSLIETKSPQIEEKRMPALGFFPKSPSSVFKPLTALTDEEKTHITSIQRVIDQLNREIQSCWSIFYNVDLKLAKKRYLQEILGQKHLTGLPFHECIGYVNEHFITMDRHLDRIYMAQDVLGGFFSHRVRDCIDNILVKEAKPTSTLSL